jgi:hypothetical protein
VGIDVPANEDTVTSQIPAALGGVTKLSWLSELTAMLATEVPPMFTA